MAHICTQTLYCEYLAVLLISQVPNYLVHVLKVSVLVTEARAVAVLLLILTIRRAGMNNWVGKRSGYNQVFLIFY